MAYGYTRQPMVEKPQFASQSNLYADRAGAGAPQQMYGMNGTGNPGGAYNTSMRGGFVNDRARNEYDRRMRLMRPQFSPQLQPISNAPPMDVGSINQQNPQGLGQGVGADLLALLQGQFGQMRNPLGGLGARYGTGPLPGTGQSGAMPMWEFETRGGNSGLWDQLMGQPTRNNPFASPAGPSAAPGMLRPNFAKPGGNSGFTRPPRGY